MKKLMSLLMALMVAFAMFPTFNAHAELADGKYSLPYQVNKSGSTSASIANDYFIKPATLVKKDGVMYVQLTFNKSSEFVKFESASGGNKVVATDDANDRRTVQFNVTDLSKPQTVNVRLEIPAQDYYHNYKIDFVWFADKSKLIEVYAAPVKEAAKPVEAKPTETKQEVKVTETKQAEKPAATEPKKEEVKKEEVKTDESTQQEGTKQEVVEESNEEVKKEAPKATDEQPATEDKKQQDTIVVASAQANDQATSNETVQQTTEESGSNTIMWIIIALAVVFAGTGGYGFYKKLSSKK